MAWYVGLQKSKSSLSIYCKAYALYALPECKLDQMLNGQTLSSTSQFYTW